VLDNVLFAFGDPTGDAFTAAASAIAKRGAKTLENMLRQRSKLREDAAWLEELRANLHNLYHA
jgi:hypothetical protein